MSAIDDLDALVIAMHATAATVHDLDAEMGLELRGYADAVSDFREVLRPRQTPETLARIVKAPWRED